MRGRLLPFFFMFLLGGCVDEIQLPARSVASRLVVEGLVTNEAVPYTVKLSYTGQYNSLIYGQQEIPVTGAVVSITEIGGPVVMLDQDPLTPLYYRTADTSFIGKPGKAYQLRVQLLNGEQYVSEPELLNAVPQIDNVYAEFKPRAEADFFDPDYYEILIDTKDPATPGNYYRWSGYGYVPRFSTGEPIGMSVCCQWCWVPTYGSDTEVLSDVLINGNNISRKPVFASPIYYVGRHYIEISQYSLTKQAYQFWVKFQEQRTRNGSLFDPLPASIEGNVHKEGDLNTLALGYFGSSAVSKKRLVIPGDTLNLGRLKIKYSNEFVKEGNCQRVYSQGQLSPPNW